MEQNYDNLWNDKERFRKLSQELDRDLSKALSELEASKKEIESLKTVVQDLRNVIAGSNLKSFGN